MKRFFKIIINVLLVIFISGITFAASSKNIRINSSKKIREARQAKTEADTYRTRTTPRTLESIYNEGNRFLSDAIRFRNENPGKSIYYATKSIEKFREYISKMQDFIKSQNRARRRARARARASARRRARASARRRARARQRARATQQANYVIRQASKEKGKADTYRLRNRTQLFINFYREGVTYLYSAKSLINNNPNTAKQKASEAISKFKLYISKMKRYQISQNVQSQQQGQGGSVINALNKIRLAEQAKRKADTWRSRVRTNVFQNIYNQADSYLSSAKALRSRNPSRAVYYADKAIAKFKKYSKEMKEYERDRINSGRMRH